MTTENELIKEAQNPEDDPEEDEEEEPEPQPAQVEKWFKSVLTECGLPLTPA